MIKWVYINSAKITRIGYNAELETMYIDFNGSSLDTPYKRVSEKLFNDFSTAKNIDGFFDTQIKGFCEEVKLDIRNQIYCGLKSVKK